jgi:serine protease Do
MLEHGLMRIRQPIFGSIVERAAINRRFLLWRGLACWLALASLGAAETSAPDKRMETKSELNSPNPKTTQALAAIARPAVVIISHSGREGREDGVGSGFVISEDGLVATSLHVIGEARPITVRMANGQRYDVTEVHAWDRKLDLAVIRVAAHQLPFLPLGDSDSLPQGAPVVAMGNPLGLEHSIVQGIVSAKRDLEGLEMIQLAIPIEQGNSGGPLLDMQGRVHGILTMKSLMSDNVGFAMPINSLKLLLHKPNPVPIERWLTIGALNPKDWTPLLGARWRQKAGRIEVDGLGKGFGGRSLCLSQKSVPERPFEVSVMVRLDDEAGAAGLIFESDSEQRQYGFYPSAGQLRLTRFDGPNVFSWTILKQVPSSHYRPGDWNQLRVRLDKGGIRCYVNDQLAIESDDQVLIGGKVGLAKFRNTKAEFRDFQIGADLAIREATPSAELTDALAKKIESFSGTADADLVSALKQQKSLSQTLLAKRARKLEEQAVQLRQLAGTVHRQSVRAELLAALKAPEEKIDLFRAALLVSKLDNADLEIEPYLQQLEGMAREILAELPEKADSGSKLEALTKYLFVENGFHGSRTDYYNRANCYMNNVLDDREGLPITLSVLFMELAQRIGLKSIVGVPLPGHFVVKFIPADGEDTLIDVFEGGKPMTRVAAKEKVLASSGRPLREEHLQPATKRDIILRIVRNLQGMARDRESASDSLGYLDLIIDLAPESPMERLDRAILRLRNGDKPGAKEDLKWILEKEPAGMDLEKVRELHRSL